MANLDFPTLQPFQPGGATPQAPASKPRTRKPSAATKSDTKSDTKRQKPAGTEPKVRKPREPKPAGQDTAKRQKGQKGVREIKLSASAVFDMMGRGLKPADVVALQKVSGVLAGLPKRSRSRIVAALAGMFA